MSLVTMVILGVKTILSLWRKLDDVMTTPPSMTGDQLYHMMQTLAYVVMATLIMRLKLFLSPQLAVLCGFIPSLLKGHVITVSIVYVYVRQQACK